MKGFEQGRAQRLADLDGQRGIVGNISDAEDARYLVVEHFPHEEMARKPDAPEVLQLRHCPILRVALRNWLFRVLHGVVAAVLLPSGCPVLTSDAHQSSRTTMPPVELRRFIPSSRWVCTQLLIYGINPPLTARMVCAS